MFLRKLWWNILGVFLVALPAFSNGLATDLFFSEYLEGLSNNKYLEIYNGTGSDINLTGYQIRLYNNGATTVSQTLNLNGTLAHNQVYIVAHLSANTQIRAKANITINGGVVSFNGDDALELVKSGTVIDAIGVVGERPASGGWSIGSINNATLDNIIIRKSNVNVGSPNFNASKDSEWEVHPPYCWSDLGRHTFDGVPADNNNDAQPEGGSIVKIFESNFECDDDLSPWTTISLASTQNWILSSAAGNFFAQINNFNADEAANDWLISPAMDLRRYVDLKLSFLNNQRFVGSDLKLFISDSYDGVSNPKTANWNELNFNKDNNTGSDNFVSSGDIDISNFNRKNVRIAFQYTSIGTATDQASRFRVDDISIEGTVVNYSAPVKLNIVNLTPASPIRNLNFEMHVEALDANNIPQPLSNNLNYTIEVLNGSGQLLGETSGVWNQGSFEIRNTLRYSATETVSFRISDNSSQLQSATINNVIVQNGPASLEFSKLKSAGHKNTRHQEIIVEAKNDFGGTQTNFNGVNIVLGIYTIGKIINAPYNGDAMNPEAFVLREGNFNFNFWNENEPSGTYPQYMRFQQVNKADPGLLDEMTAPYNVEPGDYHNDDVPHNVGFPYRLTGRSRINGLNERGISFINTGRDNRDLGAAVVGLQTINCQNIRVSFTAETILRNTRLYNMILQYRIGTTGVWIDVPNGLYEVQNNGQSQNFVNLQLPSDANDKDYVQLRWKYYFTGNGSSARSMIRLDDITITSEPMPQQEGDLYLVKTYTSQSVNGIARFINVIFDDAGDYILIADAGGLTTNNADVEIFDYPLFTDHIVPKYVIGRDPSGTIFGDKLITYALVELNGLIPNEEYRFINAMGDIDRSNDESGLQNPNIFTRGGQIYWHEEDNMSWFGSFMSFPTFSYTPNVCADNLSVRTEPYSTFRADATGNKKLWISIQGVNHSMFNNTTNRNLYWLITIANDENNIIRRYQAEQFSRPLHLNDNPSQPEIEATGMYDMNSGFEPGTYLVFYSNNEPEQPFASAIVQGDGLYLQRWNNFNTSNCTFETWFEHESPEYFRMLDGYYQVDLSNGTSGPIVMEFPEINGAWGAYIPNMLGDVNKSNLAESGLNKIEHYDSHGNLINSWFDEDGIWAGVNTNSVRGGKNNPIEFLIPTIELTSQKHITEFCNPVEGAEITWKYNGVKNVNIYTESEGVRRLIFENIPANSNSKVNGFGSINWVGERGIYSEKLVRILIESVEHSDVFDESSLFTLYDAPDFLNESVSAIRCEGENILFGVLATGSDVRYQWIKDGEILEGQTNPGLQINNLRHSNSGVYNCIVYNQNSNVCGEYYSADMVLYVHRKTEVTIQPKSVGAFAGGRAKFYFDIHGIGLPELRYNVTIQWFKGDVPLVNDNRFSGVKSNYLEIRNIQDSDFSTEADYYAVVNGRCGETTTVKVSLIKVDINFTKHPDSQDVCENDELVLEVEVENPSNLELKYQWMKDGIKLVENQTYSGVESPILNINGARITSEGEFECEITVVTQNVTVISNAAQINVENAPIIVTNLADEKEVTEGQQLELRIDAMSRKGNVKYQWFKGDTELEEETENTLLILNSALTDSGVYYSVVSNDCGENQSNRINVEIKEQGSELSVLSSKKNGYELRSPNPNPAIDKFSVEFEMPESNLYTLKLIDVVGNEINLIKNSFGSKGINKVEFNVSDFNLSNGFYLLILEVDNTSLSQKLIISK